MSRPLLRRRARRGAYAVEYALLLPPYVALVLGCIDASWVLWQRVAMEASVEEGCRTGALRDPGANFVSWSSVQSAASGAVVNRLESYGVPCRDCTVTIERQTVNSQIVLECSLERSIQPLAGLMVLTTGFAQALVEMEVQR